MTVERSLASLRWEFLLDLSSGFVYDVLRDRTARFDLEAHRRTVPEHFGGKLCVDELHLDRFTLLLATDLLADLPVVFALVEHQRSGAHAMVPGRSQGPEPDPGAVVVTDGSSL